MTFQFFNRVKLLPTKISTILVLSTTGSLLASIPLFSWPTPIYSSEFTGEKNSSLLTEKKAWELNTLKKRIIGRYENRIRSYSHPYKVFEYFATQTKHGRKYMTSNDLIRSLLPYIDISDEEQPDQLYRTLKAQSAVQFFKLADTDGDGLISLEEYLHFLSFATLPEHHFASHFSKLDLDQNGVLSKDEFVYFLDTLIQSDPYLKQALGHSQRHRLTVQSCHGLLDLFFGPHHPTLSKSEFLGFMKRLKWELLKLEFYQFQVIDDCISSKDFAYSLVSYMDPNNVVRFHQRIQGLQWDRTKERISFDEFLNMDKVAAAFQNSAENFPPRTVINKKDFKKTLDQITKISLTDTQIDIIYKVFGINEVEVDFRLLVDFGRHRQAKGLTSKIDVGLSSIFSNVSDTLRHIWMSILTSMSN
ncbi:hypothetical protein HMI56_000263 [Coelomomyces lativittatus]|nr:hypothetical protein HMI56_000263 [Coelomomyces lativittatus]